MLLEKLVNRLAHVVGVKLANLPSEVAELTLAQILRGRCLRRAARAGRWVFACQGGCHRKLGGREHSHEAAPSVSQLGTSSSETCD